MFQSEITRPYFFCAHLGERRGAVGGVVDVLETELPQQIADDADHRVVVVHDEDRHRQINSHYSCSITATVAPGKGAGLGYLIRQ